MIRIFFKTIWNNRRRNILIFIELFIVSLVLVNVTNYLVNMVSIGRIKNCYDTQNVVLLSLYNKTIETDSITEQSFNKLALKFSSHPSIESISLSSMATPYTYNLSSSTFKHDSDQISMALRMVDINYAKVLKIIPLKGRWFNDTDIGKLICPILISWDIEDKYFKGNAIGKRIIQGSNEYEIIGVVDHFKRSDIEKPYSSAFIFQGKPKQDYWGKDLLIRTKEGKTRDILAVAESYVYSTLDTQVWVISSLNSLENMREKQNDESVQRNFLSLIIAFFIMLNVLLGVTGILWYNTNLRIHEIGIKRSLGATSNNISRLLLAENMLLAGIGLIIVILIFVQLPTLLNGGEIEPGVFIKTIWISISIMIFLVLLSTWIPASLASKIHPATALKTE